MAISKERVLQLAELLEQGKLKDTSSLTPEYRAALRDYMIAKKTHLARSNFHEFVKLMAPAVLENKFEDGAHIRLICNELQKIVEDLEWNERNFALPKGQRKPMRKPRLQVSLPPRSMKSKLCSNLLPAWAMGRNPTWCIIAIGMSTTFAQDNLGRLTKNIIETEEFAAIFPQTAINRNVRSSGRWETTRGGKYFSAGAETGYAGRGANLIIADDVLSEQTAFSDIEREKINAWYWSIRVRQNPAGGGEIIVNTRWHMHDLSASTLEKDQKGPYPWKVVSIPAFLDKATAKLLGKEVGESYWPEVWDKDHLNSMKASMSPAKFAAQYMQTPIPEEGSLIKQDWFRIWSDKKPPKVDYVVASLDTAFATTQRADYTALTVWGVFFTYEVSPTGRETVESNLILLSAEKGKYTFSELLSKCEDIKAKHDPNLFIVEKKGSGHSLIQELRLAKYPTHEYNPDKDKTTRVYACEPIFRSGRVFIPKDRPWLTDYLFELCNFPYAQHDDYVDSTTQAVIWMREQLQLPQVNEIGYDSLQEEEDDTYEESRPRSYWDSV